MWCFPHVPIPRSLLKIGQEKREADPPRPRAGQAAAMAHPDSPAPSSSSTSAPSVGSTSGSTQPRTGSRCHGRCACFFPSQDVVASTPWITQNLWSRTVA